MRIIIVGAGLVGTQLARHLTREKNEVSLIESDEERARYASNRLDCLVIHSEGNSLEALLDAGLEKADALVCVTSSDEINMIICGIAGDRYPRLLKIARVRNDDYFNIKLAQVLKSAEFNDDGNKKLLGIDHLVHPNIEAARTALDAIEHNAAGDVLSFADTDYELGSIEVGEGSVFDGLLLMNYRNVVPGDTLVTLVERAEDCILPQGQTRLQVGDRVYILAPQADMDALFEMGHRRERAISKIGIVGGGHLGSLVAHGLMSYTTKSSFKFFEFIKRGLAGAIKIDKRRIFIIEKNYSLCKELSAQFPQAVILNEDISDENFVIEEQINDLDLIVTATGNQELNIITALYLKARGVTRAVAFVSSDGYARIARRLGIDVVIPVKSVIVDSIIARLLGRGVLGIHRMGDGTISIFEFEITKTAPVAGKKITEFRIDAGALLMLVRRNVNSGGSESFIPRGDYVFCAGDKIIIIAKKGSEKEMEKYFGVTL
jgi:trk system potassium uptake protein TrkA